MPPSPRPTEKCSGRQGDIIHRSRDCSGLGKGLGALWGASYIPWRRPSNLMGFGVICFLRWGTWETLRVKCREPGFGARNFVGAPPVLPQTVGDPVRGVSRDRKLGRPCQCPTWWGHKRKKMPLVWGPCPLGSRASWPRGSRAGRVDADTAGSAGGWPAGLQDPEGTRVNLGKSRGLPPCVGPWKFMSQETLRSWGNAVCGDLGSRTASPRTPERKSLGRAGRGWGAPATGLQRRGRRPGRGDQRCVQGARSRGALRGTRRRRRRGARGPGVRLERDPASLRFTAPPPAPQVSGLRLRGASGRRKKPERLEAETRRPFPGSSGRNSARGHLRGDPRAHRRRAPRAPAPRA